MAKCSSRSPLIRSGITQAGRDIAELQPAWFRIDERDLADMVLYAQALSRQIAFYNPDNQPAGDWQAFFAADITATLAALARLPVESFRIALGDAEEFLRDDPERAEPELRAYFNLIFHLPVALFGELAKGHARLNRDHPLHGLLAQLVADDLAGPLADLLRFYKGAVGAGLPLEDPEPPLVAADYGSGAPADRGARLVKDRRIKSARRDHRDRPHHGACGGRGQSGGADMQRQRRIAADADRAIAYADFNR
jgi:hypothetical protein